MVRGQLDRARTLHRDIVETETVATAAAAMKETAAEATVGTSADVPGKKVR